MKDFSLLYDLFSTIAILITGFIIGFYFHKKVVTASRNRKIEAFKAWLVENGNTSTVSSYEQFLKDFVDWETEERTVGRRH